MKADLLPKMMSGHLISSETILHPWERKDLTEMTYRYLFPPLKADKVSLQHGTLIGLPGSGKTETINDIAYHTLDHYHGPQNVNVVFCDWLQDALDNMDARPVQLLLVDDSIKNANSRKSGGNADDIADYFEIRHVFERTARTRTGVIILIYVAQRFKSLDIVFRNAMFLFSRPRPSIPTIGTSSRSTSAQVPTPTLRRSAPGCTIITTTWRRNGPSSTFPWSTGPGSSRAS